MPEVSLLTIAAVCERTGLCRTTIYHRATNGTFPKAVKIGRAVRWRSDEVAAWIERASENRAEFNVQVPRGERAAA